MKALDSLYLYKRHSATCSAGATLSPDLRKFHWECPCPIWIFGQTPDGQHVPRQSTGCRDLPTAETFRDALLSKYGGGSGPVPAGLTIEEATRRYKASRKDELGRTTSQQYNVLLRRLIAFCASQGVTLMSDLTADLLERFKVEGLPPQTKATSRATMVAKLKAFLRAAHKRDWISLDLANKIEGVVAHHEMKEPYTDDEVTRILEAAGQANGPGHANGSIGRYASKPHIFRLLCELMLSTGMRCGDATLFRPSQCSLVDGVWTYGYVQQKTKKGKPRKEIEAYIPTPLMEKIQAIQDGFSPERPFNWGIDRQAAAVYERLRVIGAQIGVADCRPHRFRDTFAVRMLLKGMQLEDVSRLLGHASIAITERYYAKWVTGRKLRLARLVSSFQ